MIVIIGVGADCDNKSLRGVGECDIREVGADCEIRGVGADCDFKLQIIEVFDTKHCLRKSLQRPPPLAPTPGPTPGPLPWSRHCQTHDTQHYLQDMV